MALGVLRVQCLPSTPERIHYGSQDIVTGSVLITFTADIDATPGTELFGPLKIDVDFEGTFHAVRDGIGKTRVLFHQQQTLCNGPHKLEPQARHEFPFEFEFPEYANEKQKISITAFQDEATGQWNARRQRASYACNEPLPPTLHSTKSYVLAKDEIIVQYTLSVTVSMPGISVDIINPVAPTAALYDQPKVPIAVAASRSRAYEINRELTVQSNSLLPEDSQPHGFRGKTKALLRPAEAPKCVFHVVCRSIPEFLYIGQPITFTIAVSSGSSSTALPEIELKSCVVSLVAQTSLEAEPDDAPDSQISNHLEVVKTKECEVSPSGPFAKGHDYTKKVDVGVLSQIPSSFQNSDMSRSYWLRLVITVTAAREERTITRQCAVIVHPPLLLDDDRMAYEDPPDEDDAPPPYNAVVAGPST